MATYAENLIATRDGLAAIVAAQTAAWVAAGCPPTMSIEGESYSWNEWYQGKLDAIEKLNALIRAARPYWLQSRHRG